MNIRIIISSSLKNVTAILWGLLWISRWSYLASHFYTFNLLSAYTRGIFPAIDIWFNLFFQFGKGLYFKGLSPSGKCIYTQIGNVYNTKIGYTYICFYISIYMYILSLIFILWNNIILIIIIKYIIFLYLIFILWKAFSSLLFLNKFVISI